MDTTKAIPKMFYLRYSMVQFTKQNKKPRLYLSEVNTIPGFTEISMYPKLLSLNGVKLEKIIDKILCLKKWA